jgi:predicted helicase
MPLQKYIEDVQKQFKTGIAREHAYRPALKTLIEELMPEVTAINDPAHIKCGAPDFILHRRNLEVGYMEAKDLDADLSKTEKTDQLKRYLESLDNLVLTDYLEFRFFLRSEKVEVVRIAEIENGVIKPLPENYDRLKTLLIDFAAFQGQTIKSAKKLATMMAQKAKLMKHIFYNVITSEEDSSLKDQLKAFQSVLMHDMDEAQFADVYAQTIAYGLFTARLHDKTKDDFSRSEALLLIPKSNPFLRQLFSYVAGSELDERVVWIVDALCEVFLFSDLDKILAEFGSATGQNDPMLHFYETFLAEYDKKLRKARGVWYTPEPVVNFIVRAIDEVLKTHFDLKDGIADKSKITIEVEDQAFDKRTKTGLAKKKMDVHKVQLLDVATGTGTFLAEAVKQIYKKYKGQEGIWSSYVENDLLPRIHGFELLMASYAMCHMKLDLLLQETGYKPINVANPPRLSVYLTNALEEHHPEMDTLFASWLSREANEASWIKKNMPIMVAFGNPPYSGHSSNNGEWITKLIEDYKKEPGGKIKLQERNAKYINDDYAKFIRMGEHYIHNNGGGVLAYITNNGYLDNPTFRGMRWHLMDTFDLIYIINLHGNSNKKEVTPDGKPDINVFDIRQGVSIIIAVKSEKEKKDLAEINYIDLWGKRDEKYDFLKGNNISNVNWMKVMPANPNYFFIPIDYKLVEEYKNGFSINELMPVRSNGFKTHRDDFAIDFNAEPIKKRIQNFMDLNISDEEMRQIYNLKDNRDWSLAKARQQLSSKKDNWQDSIVKCTYRPLDTRFCYYSDLVMDYPRSELQTHMYNRDNLGIIIPKQANEEVGGFATKQVCEHKTFGAYNSNYIFPLYRYEDTMGKTEQKVPNLNPKIYTKIKKVIPDVTPESLFDYIYAVLHAPEYRARYAEFLKSDFPRIPYPDDPAVFHALAGKGAKLRGLHLMESDALDDLITTYPQSGDNEVIKPRYEDGKVWINESQYFGGVPELAWNFYIGGYQPAQKWLKDRKTRTLEVDDIMHYQRIIVALTETDRIMKKINAIKFLPEEKL